MTQSTIFKSISALILAVLLLNCATRVSRVKSDSTMDISGRWNDTDSRLVAQQMINDCLNQRWLYKYQEKRTNPKVIVGEIRNKSHEHISVETFVKDMERELLNSGRVEFVANKHERKQLREEVADQSQNASAQTRKYGFEEIAADLMLIGTISAIVDSEGTRAVVFYQVDLELIELESNMKRWVGNKKIKKYVQRSKMKI